MSFGVLLPLLAFFALGVPIVVLLWRVLVVGGELRREAQHGGAARDIARRAAASLSELAEAVDALRRGKAQPDELARPIAEASDALRRCAVDAALVDKDADRDGHAAVGSLVEVIGRAERAVELVEHGRGLMLTGAVDLVDEGETAVKRGYLNLLHARDAIKATADDLAAAWAGPDRGSGRG